jgi:hypothetical protein
VQVESVLYPVPQTALEAVIDAAHVDTDQVIAQLLCAQTIGGCRERSSLTGETETSVAWSSWLLSRVSEQRATR